jgi:hypothetical protein
LIPFFALFILITIGIPNHKGKVVGDLSTSVRTTKTKETA